MSTDDTNAVSPPPRPVSVSDLLRREGQGDEQAQVHRGTRLYPVLAAAAGLALLCGSVVASTAALTGPRAERAAPAAITTPVLGADALRPDVINSSFGDLRPAGHGADGGARSGAAPGGSPDRTVPPGGDGTPGGDGATSADGASSPPGPPSGDTTNRDSTNRDSTNRDSTNRDGASSDTTAPGPPAATRTPAGPPATTPPAEQGTPQQPSPGTDPVLDTVSSFYRSATVTPREAFSLLAPPLRSDGYAAFRQAWADVERVSVDRMSREGPDTAEVTVTIVRDDGDVLRTLQLVRVVPGSQPHIIDARLLSASRS